MTQHGSGPSLPVWVPDKNVALGLVPNRIAEDKPPRYENIKAVVGS